MSGSRSFEDSSFERMRAREQGLFGPTRARSVAPSTLPGVTTGTMGPQGAGFIVNQQIGINFAKAIEGVPTEVLRHFYDDLMKELGKRGADRKL